MLDRESTFAHPQIVDMLKTRFVPVAIDQAYQRRQQDTEGEFYRKIAGQGPRSNFKSTTQGFYVATPSGKLLLYNNNRNPEKVARLLREKLAQFEQESKSNPEKAAVISAKKVDPRWNVQPPKGGLVARVNSKILDGYEPTTDRWRRIFNTALSRDNLWISAVEQDALAQGDVPESLQERIARFHLVDNTRGEPPMWQPEDIRRINMEIKDGVLSGSVKLSTKNGDRGYDVELLGNVEAKNGRVIRFDVVALGEFWGEGRYTRGAPKGRFPLAIAFRLADGSDVADRVPPQGSRGWVRGYIR